MRRHFRKLLRPRLLPLHAGAVALLLLADPNAASVAVGAGLIVAGLALRAWGAGHLVKTRRLATGGPYAYLRHPLYAGSLLVGLGFGVAAGGPALVGALALAVPAFLFYYLPYKERIESARLERRYGATYAAYRARVPALLPTLRPFRAPGAVAAAWSLARYRANHEVGVAAAVLGGLALMTLRPALAL